MRQYILRGDDKHIADIIQENALRVRWGKVEFIPLPHPEGVDDKVSVIADTKKASSTDTKETKKRK